MPAQPQPPKKQKLLKKLNAQIPVPHAPASTKPVNLVTFTFHHQPPSFISKSEKNNLKK